MNRLRQWGRAYSRTTILWLVAWAACLVAFISLGVVVSGREDPGFDLDLAREVQKLPEAIGDVLGIANFLGGGWPLAVLTGAAAALFLARGQRIEALLLMSSLIPRFLQERVKEVFDAPRPSADMLEVREFLETAAYPSGHVVGTTVVFVLLFMLVPKLSGDPRLVRTMRLLCVAMVMSVSVARVWSGAHWPTDCLGGYLFATAWLMPSVWLYRSLALSIRG